MMDSSSNARDTRRKSGSARNVLGGIHDIINIQDDDDIPTSGRMIGLMNKRQQEERDRLMALRLQEELNEENEPVVEPTLTPEQIAAILGEDVDDDMQVDEAPVRGPRDRGMLATRSQRVNRGGYRNAPPVVRRVDNVNAPGAARFNRVVLESDDSDESEGEDLDDDMDSDNTLNNTYGRDSFVISDDGDSSIDSFDGDSDSEYEVPDDAEEDDVSTVSNPLNTTAPTDVLRSGEHGKCTICFEDMPYDPVGCLHCKQLIGCRRCVNHWYESGVRMKARGGSIDGHAPHNHFQCPLCRHEWEGTPEIASVFDLLS